MIAILTDKPSVGKEIGRIIGATKVRNGYVEGNGYMVTRRITEPRSWNETIFLSSRPNLN